jgi:hypothetical protein
MSAMRKMLALLTRGQSTHVMLNMMKLKTMNLIRYLMTNCNIFMTRKKNDLLITILIWKNLQNYLYHHRLNLQRVMLQKN